MKNRKRNLNRGNRHELKKARETRIILIAVLAVIITLGVCYYFTTQPPAPEPEIESYIRSMLTQKDIAPGLEPAAIYYRHPGMTSESFCCIGTLFYDTNCGVQIATAEHVFRTDIHAPQTLSIRALRGKMDPPITYVDHILATGRELGGANHEERDIVVASVGFNPVILDPYSGFLDSEIGQNFWGDVIIGKTKIPRLRSLVSGEYVNTLGYLRRGEGTNGAVFVLIDRHTRRGESGTGYVDDYGGLWVVHAGTDSRDEESQICEEGRRITGKKITGVTTVSGPLFGHYQ